MIKKTLEVKSDGNYEQLTSDEFPLVCLNMPDLKAMERDALTHLQRSSLSVCVAIPLLNTRAYENSDPDTKSRILKGNEYYRSMARVHGVNLFFMANTDASIVVRTFSRLPAHHILEYAALHQFTGAQVSIGIPRNFPNRDYITGYLQDVYPSVPVSETLEQTCAKAVELCYRK